MSPTVFKIGSYRFFFFSREETRMHVHITSSEGEAKFWIEPLVSLASNKGLSSKQLRHLQQLVEEHIEEISDAWKKHFPS